MKINLTFADISLSYKSPKDVGAVVTVCWFVEGLFSEEVAMSSLRFEGICRAGVLIAIPALGHDYRVFTSGASLSPAAVPFQPALTDTEERRANPASRHL